MANISNGKSDYISTQSHFVPKNIISRTRSYMKRYPINLKVYLIKVLCCYLINQTIK